MSDRKIAGAIQQGGRIYKAGDEDALAKVLKPHAYDRLLKLGAITGSWGGKSSKDEPPEPTADNAVHGEPINISDEERASLPTLEPLEGTDVKNVEGKAKRKARKSSTKKEK